MLLNICCKRFYTLVLSIFFSIILCSISFAQTGTIKGRVINENSKETLIGANVLIKGTKIGAATDFDGNFIIRNVEPGEKELIITYIDYLPKSVKVEVKEGEIIDIEVSLEDTTSVFDELIRGTPARGQLAAVNNQISSDNIIYSTAIEKMRNFPYDNVPEAIGRMPGISLYRRAGEASELAIRGFSPKYNNLTIEGVPLVSTNQNDRGIDLSLLDIESIHRADISNSLRPDLDANSLGGTVNLKLKEIPCDLNYDIRVEGRYNNLRDTYNNYKFAGVVSNRFCGYNLGILALGNVEFKQLPSEQFSAGYSKPIYSYMNNGYEIRTDSASLRDNITARHRFNAGLIINYYLGLVELNFYNLYSAEIDSNITREFIHDFENNNLRSGFSINKLTTKQRMHSLQASFMFGKIELPVSLSYTGTERNLPNSQQFDFLSQPDLLFPTYKRVYAEPYELMKVQGVQNPENTGLYRLNRFNSKLSDDSYDAKIGLKIPVRLTRHYQLNVSGGGKYHDVHHRSDNRWFYYDLGNNNSINRRIHLIEAFDYLKGSNPNVYTGIEAKYFINKGYDRKSILGYPVGSGYDIYKLSNMLNSIYPAWGNDFTENYSDGIAQNYDYKDKTYAGYVMGELMHEYDFSITAGVRYQEEKFNVSAYHLRIGNVSTGNDDYIGLEKTQSSFLNSVSSFPAWYPSLNIKYYLLDYLQLKGAVYKSCALPGYREMSPFVTFYESLNMESGNPKLKPSTAWNFDFRTSVFKNEIGILTADFFYKEISDLVTYMDDYYPYQPFSQENLPTDISERLPSKDYYNDVLGVNQLLIYAHSTIPMNNPYKAYLRGIELSCQTNFW